MKKPFHAFLTKQNHLRLVYSASRFAIRFGRSQRKSEDLRTEVILAVKEVAALAKSDFCVFLSGGKDSEVLLRACIAAKLRPKILVFRYEQDKNASDVYSAVKICDELSFRFELVDFHVQDFFASGEADGVAQEAKCALFDFLPLLRNVRHFCRLGYYPVIASGEPYLIKKRGLWYLRERQDVASLLHFCQKQRLVAAPAFYQWSPELLQAFLSDRRWGDLLAKNLEAYDSHPIKEQMYFDHFGVALRPNSHGFEKLKDVRLKYGVPIAKRFKAYQKVQLTPFERVLAWTRYT